MSKEEVPLHEPVCRLSLRAFVIVVFMVLSLWFTASPSAQEDKTHRYEVDAAWHKPLPNNWLIGQVGGLAVDKHDHTWINRQGGGGIVDHRHDGCDVPDVHKDAGTLRTTLVWLDRDEYAVGDHQKFRYGSKTSVQCQSKCRFRRIWSKAAEYGGCPPGVDEN